MTDREVLARGIELLRRRHGDRWEELPAHLGRRLADAEDLLVSGPTAVDPATAAPSEAARRASHMVRSAASLGDLVTEEAEVLGEALGAELADLPLRAVDEVVGAVMDLALAGRADITWSNPSAALAARVVVDAHGDDLRATAEMHHRLYEDFTDDVLQIPQAWLRSGRRRWRVAARARLRRSLCDVSRTGQLPGPLTELAVRLLDVHAARAELVQLAPLLASHLGRHYQGPLTDVDAAAAALGAVRRLQGALGERLDAVRLAGLIGADAFASTDLTGPATKIRTALQSWCAELATLGGAEPWALPARELSAWAAGTAAVLPDLTAAVEATSALPSAPPTLRALVDDLLAREVVEEVRSRASADGRVASKGGSAS